MTKLTICMPVYNDSEYLPRSIGSILNQTYGDFRLLIYDDGSTDDAVDRIRAFGDDRIVLIEGKENKGGSFARSKLIEALDTEFCIWCDADDKFAHDHAFQIAMGLMEPSDYDWINFARFNMIDSNNFVTVYDVDKCGDFSYRGDDFFRLYYVRRKTNFLNSKIFRSDLLRKCIPEEKYMMKKYATHDVFFTTMCYYHTEKHYHTEAIPPLYTYYTDIGFTGIKKGDTSIGRTRNLCVAFHDCLMNSWDKMTEVLPLDSSETNMLVKGMIFQPLKSRMEVIRRNCNDDEIEKHLAVVGEYFCKDGSHVLSDSDIIESPSLVRQFNNAIRGVL